MKRENLILPAVLRQIRSTGVLNTTEKVRQASEELRAATAPAFEEFRISRQKSLEESTRTFLD
jgi:prophage antirepressor-like protein